MVARLERLSIRTGAIVMNKAEKIWSLFFGSTDPIHAASRQTAAAGVWTDMDLSRVASQARQALEQKRLKNCLVLTKLLLQADAENEEAHALQSSVRSALQQDLQAARALLEDPQLHDKPEVFGKGAEIILSRVLSVDPENEEARALLSILKTRL